MTFTKDVKCSVQDFFTASFSYVRNFRFLKFFLYDCNTRTEVFSHSFKVDFLCGVNFTFVAHVYLTGFKYLNKIQEIVLTACIQRKLRAVQFLSLSSCILFTHIKQDKLSCVNCRKINARNQPLLPPQFDI